MIDFLFLKEVLPFTISLCAMFCLAAVEGVGIILGIGFFTFLDNMIPDIDLDIDADLPQSGLTIFLSWMNIKKVPLLVVIICCLTVFGLVGIMGQYSLRGVFGFLVPLPFALPIVLLLSLPLIKLFINFVYAIMPKDESTALLMESFVGKSAVITLGKARKNFPAECRLEDKYGQTHYFMVEPEEDGVEFVQGESILLSKINKKGFYAIKNSFNILKS